MADSLGTALITGGANRIGAALCRALHQRGFNIALHYFTSEQPAQTLAAELNQERADSCISFSADLQDPTQLRAALAAIDTSTISLLVNNASAFYKTPLATSTTEEWDTILATNLRAPWVLSQTLAPSLRTNNGSIINITDAHTVQPQAHYAAYNTSKSGLNSLSQQLALELAPAIRVNAIAPGAILWPEEETLSPAEQQAFLNNIPLQRLGSCEDIARCAVFLACDAPYITGQILAVDGGRSISSGNA